MQQCGVGGVAVSDLSQHRPVLGRGGATVLTIVTGPAAAAAAAAPAAASGEAGPAAVSETAALWSGFTTVATVSGSPTAFIGMPSGLRGDGGRGGGGHGSVRLGVAREPCIWSAQPRPAGGPTSTPHHYTRILLTSETWTQQLRVLTSPSVSLCWVSPLRRVSTAVLGVDVWTFAASSDRYPYRRGNHVDDYFLR